MSHQTLMVLAHLKTHAGTGGQKGMVQELQSKWKEQLDHDPPGLAQWQDFKEFCCKKPKEFDHEGLTKAKLTTAHAKSVHNQQDTINQQNSDHVDEFQKQLGSLSHAMSIMTQPPTPTQPAVPSPSSNLVPAAICPSASSCASALTPDQSCQMLQEERIRNDELRHEINQPKQAFSSSSMEGTSPTFDTNTTTNDCICRQHSPTEQIIQRDSEGHEWFQVAHCCSKHGCNHTHSNNKRNDKHKTNGSPWTEGATRTNHKGGNDRNSDAFQHWCNSVIKQHATVLP